jgi:adenylosuccinate lyase
MIERYSREKMRKIWESKFDYYLSVEIAAAQGYAQLGIFPADAVDEIKKHARFDLKRIAEIEQEVRHDVIAFLTNVNENIGEDLAKYLHVGMTSSDVIDTGFALQIQDSATIIKEDLDAAVATLRKLAQQHRDTVCVGRSHGMHAEPMTFGVKLCSWIDILERQRDNFVHAAEQIRVGQISGPVGTYSQVPPEVEEVTCENLGLKPARVSTQVIARDYHAYFMQSLALIATVLEQFATDIRLLHQSEILELEEGFGAGQKGSSAMPHKKNPVLSENLCGLARVVRANSQAALENIVLWHERDISHSSAERIIFPDSLIIVDFMLHRFNEILENLVVNKENMLRNASDERIFSQKILLKLIEQGKSREEAYKIVQKAAFESKLKDIIPVDLHEFLENIDTIYERVL